MTLIFYFERLYQLPPSLPLVAVVAVAVAVAVVVAAVVVVVVVVVVAVAVVVSPKLATTTGRLLCKEKHGPFVSGRLFCCALKTGCADFGCLACSTFFGFFAFREIGEVQRPNRAPEP